MAADRSSETTPPSWARRGFLLSGACFLALALPALWHIAPMVFAPVLVAALGRAVEIAAPPGWASALMLASFVPLAAMHFFDRHGGSE